MSSTDDQRNRPQRLKAVARCAVCNGEFGLIRHYRCGAALCSRKCVEHFALRRDSDSRWLWRFRVA